jgi:hypothetical protein
MTEKSSRRLWKNYTNRIVNLTATRDGEITGCNHGLAIIVEPIREAVRDGFRPATHHLGGSAHLIFWGARGQSSRTRRPRMR